MAKYRKKPVVIEAICWSPHLKAIEVPAWLTLVGGHGVKPGSADNVLTDDGCLHIRTLEGVMVANPGDWIIQGVQGELYPCKPDIFAATYEPADA